MPLDQLKYAEENSQYDNNAMSLITTTFTLDTFRNLNILSTILRNIPMRKPLSFRKVYGGLELIIIVYKNEGIPYYILVPLIFRIIVVMVSWLN